MDTRQNGVRQACMCVVTCVFLAPFVGLSWAVDVGLQPSASLPFLASADTCAAAFVQTGDELHYFMQNVHDGSYDVVHETATRPPVVDGADAASSTSTADEATAAAGDGEQLSASPSATIADMPANNGVIFSPTQIDFVSQ